MRRCCICPLERGPDLTQAGGHLLADVFGWFGPSPATADGRYVPLGAPTRVLDTRDPNQVPVPNPGDTANCGDFPNWEASGFSHL